MYKTKEFLKWLAHVYISFIFKEKKVYVVNGLRRSGNHAFINWLSNALEKKDDVEFENIYRHVDISSDKQILFFNEVNWLGIFWFINVLRENKDKIKQSNYIIISLEDYIPKINDPFIPKEAIKIAIKRSTFNVIGSRLKRAVNQAKNGCDRGDMAINDVFIKYFVWLINNEEDWDVWDFDLWIDDNDNYRKSFLNKFKLEYNCTPKISTQGDGSSFLHRNIPPQKEDLKSRWKSVDLPERVLNLLKENKHILNDAEKEILKSLK